jgi:hypothetical protein
MTARTTQSDATSVNEWIPSTSSAWELKRVPPMTFMYDAENGVQNHANDRDPGRRMLLGFEIILALLAGLIGLFHRVDSGFSRSGQYNGNKCRNGWN